MTSSFASPTSRQIGLHPSKYLHVCERIAENAFHTTPEVRITKMRSSTLGKSEPKKNKLGDQNKMIFQWSTHTIEPSAAQPLCILNETEEEKKLHIR